MKNIIQKLAEANLINPPKFVIDGLQYVAVAGSKSYGVKNSDSDTDLICITIPPREMVYMYNTTYGYDRVDCFDTYQKHHIDYNASQYDVCIYNIIKFFALLRENNPNIIDYLYSPDSCVLLSTSIMDRIRERRNVFLHKGCYVKFCGYAVSQLKKLHTPKTGKRSEVVERFGYDVKNAYHVIRLLLEVEQILKYGTLELNTNGTFLEYIKGGNMKLDEFLGYFHEKEKEVEALYESCSVIPEGPREQETRAILVEALETCYGDNKNV